MSEKGNPLRSFDALAPCMEMKALLEHSDRSIIILDSSFRILWFNSKAARGMYGFYNQELKTGYTYWDYADESKNKRFIRNFKASLNGRTISTEQKIVKPGVDPKELWVEGRFSPLTDSENKAYGVVYSYKNITNRKKTERESADREHVLQAIDRNDSQAFILLSEDDRILSCNLLAPAMLATQANEKDPYGLDIVKCIHPSWKDGFESGLKIARSGGTVTIEFEKPEPENNIIEIRFTPVKDRLGKKNMVSIWGIDITDKKGAEREVKRSEENLRAVFNSSSQTFYLLDRNLNILAFNDPAARLVKQQFGIDLKIGMNVIDITAKENLVQFRVETERAFSGRKVQVEKHFVFNGKEYWFDRHINPVTNANGKIDRITLWSIDITDRKLAEKALKENEAKFRKLASLLPVGIYQVDANGNTTYINESLQLIIGSGMSALLDGSWTNQIDKRDVKSVMTSWNAMEKKRKKFSMEYRFIREDGEMVHLMEQAQPLFNHLGEYRGYLGTVIDITERQQAQELLKEKQVAENSLKFRSDFLASMSHEIRTPLNGILGMSEVLLDSKLSKDQESKIRNILKASTDLRSIVNEVLDLSKLEAGKVELEVEAFDLDDFLKLVQERFRLEAERKQLNLKIDNTCKKTSLLSDRRRITQVLSNLVRNAIKFTPQGGVTVKVLPEGLNGLKFEIIDTGLGIPVKDRKKLFQDFSQLDHTTAQNLEGTGLGLSISKKLIHLLNGEIGVTSRSKKGSTFWFTLPNVINTEKKNNPPSKKPTKQKVKDINVLLVEDNLINQQAFKIMLQKMGCKVKVLSNGKQAVDSFTESKYDIVFMDIQMPEMDGLEATSEIKKRFTNVPPVIGLSGNVLKRDKDGNLESDMDDLLTKPVASNELQRMINKWVA